MVITLPPEIEQALREVARRRGVTPEELALAALRERFPPQPPLLEPQDEWERGLRAAAIDRGVSLPDSAWSREEMYD